VKLEGWVFGAAQRTAVGQDSTSGVSELCKILQLTYNLAIITYLYGTNTFLYFNTYVSLIMTLDVNQS